MPEWPELNAWSAQMNAGLKGAIIDSLETDRPQMLNLAPQEMNGYLSGRTVNGVRNLGKWMLWELDEGLLALNFNMGADFLLGLEPVKDARLRVRFRDGRLFSVRFWFLGYAVYAEDLESCPALKNLGPDCMALPMEEFCTRIKGRRNLKALLLDQHTLCGIGNYYIHDLLFLSGLHPARRAESLERAEKERLYRTLHELFSDAARQGGASYERGPDGQPGRFRDSLVGYKEGQPCPNCGTPIEKLRLSASHVYLCPNCQRAPSENESICE